MLYDGFGERDRFLRALEAIEAAADLASLKAVLDGLRDAYGVKHAVFFAFAHAEVAQDAVLFTYPVEWVQHYLGCRYQDIDPVMRVGVQSIVPLDWATLDRSPPPVRQFFGEADDVGVGSQGLTLPSRGPFGAQALFTVTADVSASEWRGHRIELMRDMGVIGSHFHAKLLALQRGASLPGRDAAHLTAREREALQWAAAGKTIDQTAAILGLSPSAVRTYLDMARRKLNCLTKPQAVAVAMKLGLIDG